MICGRNTLRTLMSVSYTHLVLAVVVMGIMFRNTDDLMERANQSITALNSVMIEYCLLYTSRCV